MTSEVISFPRIAVNVIVIFLNTASDSLQLGLSNTPTDSQQTDSTECPGYDTKLYEGEFLVMLEL